MHDSGHTPLWPGDEAKCMNAKHYFSYCTVMSALINSVSAQSNIILCCVATIARVVKGYTLLVC